jgi:hypothetical protein
MGFDGLSGYVAVPDAASLDMTGDLTLEAWVKPAAVDTSSHTIVGKGTGSKPDTRQYRIGMTTPKGSTPTWRGTVYIGTTLYAVDSTTAPAVGAWTHIVAARESALLTLYINGQAEGTTMLPSSANINVTNGSFDIGRFASGTEPQFFDGVIDEVAVYNRALTAVQVRDHYNLGAFGRTHP